MKIHPKQTNRIKKLIDTVNSIGVTRGKRGGREGRGGGVYGDRMRFDFTQCNIQMMC